MSELSDKNKTNRKWTSTEKYRDNHERIFGKKTEDKKPEEEKK